jgi:hypothetical protein
LAVVILSSRLGIAALLLALASRADAQARRVLASDHPQAQLMGYYAAVMALTPIGTAVPGLEIGGELSFIPGLSDDQRRVGFGGTKYEDTNRCPVLPRLRAARTGALFTAEVGYVPPLTVCGVTANLLGVAVSAPLLSLHHDWRLALRVNALAGSLAASITCSDDAVADPADLVCYQGTPSDDRVRPFAVGADVLLLHAGHRHPRLDLYGLVGVRRERVRFDVNFTNAVFIAPQLFDDHERLEATLTRAHLAAGATWRLTRRFRVAAELFHAPGALTTVRGRVGWLLGRSQAP